MPRTMCTAFVGCCTEAAVFCGLAHNCFESVSLGDKKKPAVLLRDLLTTCLSLPCAAFEPRSRQCTIITIPPVHRRLWWVPQISMRTRTHRHIDAQTSLPSEAIIITTSHVIRLCSKAAACTCCLHTVLIVCFINEIVTNGIVSSFVLL